LEKEVNIRDMSELDKIEKKYNHHKVKNKQLDYLLAENSQLYKELEEKEEGKIISQTILGKKTPTALFTCLLPPPNITGKLHLGHM
jgi:valyl-tRNA synthetase